MPNTSTPQEDEQAAKVRLALIRTQAVGIVDHAANGETFLTLKSMDGQTSTPPAAPPAEAQKAPDAPPAPAPSGPMKLPGATKAALVAALGSLLEHITEAATLVQGAEVDDAAEPMPSALLAHMIAADDALDDALGPYDVDDEMMSAPGGTGPTPPPGGDQTSSAQKAASDPPAGGAAPAPPAPDATPKKPKPRLALKRLAEMALVHKALTDSCAKLGEHIAWAQGPVTKAAPAPAGGDMAPAKKELDPYTQLYSTLGAARDRLYAVCDKLYQAKDAAAVASASEELKQILAMLDNAKTLSQPGGGIPVQVAPAQMATPAPASADTPAQKNAPAPLDLDLAPLVAALKGAIDPVLLDMKTTIAKAQQTALAAAASADRALKSVGAPQALPPEERVPPAPAPAKSFETLLAEAKKAKAQEEDQARKGR